jgi:Glycosyl hydrolase catalytic core
MISCIGGVLALLCLFSSCSGVDGGGTGVERDNEEIEGNSRLLRSLSLREEGQNRGLQGSLGSATGGVWNIGSSGQNTTIFRRECPPSPIPLPLPGKRGNGLLMRELGHPKGGTWDVNLPKLRQVHPYWSYSWGPARPAEQPTDIEFAPTMPAVWPRSLDTLQNILDIHVLPEISAGHVKRMLGVNEPDRADQGNMPVAVALKMWPLLESLGIPLISPSAANATGKWMKEFMRQADELCLRVDYIGVHWYGGAGNVEAFKTRMQNIYTAYGSKRPLIITEFAPADWKATSIAENKWTPECVLGFMKQVLPWLEEQSWIAGYSWFSFPNTNPHGYSSSLFDDNGQLNQLGRFYASVSTQAPYGNVSIT